jgi:NhaC family Na+:H+ antiporter
MDSLFGLTVSCAVLITSVLWGQSLVWPLLIAIATFLLIHLRRGQGLQPLLTLWWRGAKQSWPVFSILLLIGALISTWLAAGTVPALVYYGTQLIHPQYFILSAFLLTALVSVLIGTSFGSAGTIGLALMILARGSQFEHLDLVAGAIIAGAYVGDRCSPLSSSAHLVAILTQTGLYHNLKNMLLTALLPLVLSLGIYGVLSPQYPLGQMTDTIAPAIAETFNIQAINLLPALLVLVLAAWRVNVKVTMLVSLMTASMLSLSVQHYTPGDLLKFVLLGFILEDHPLLQPMLQGGGLGPMARVCSIVFLSTGLAGLLVGTNSLSVVNRWLQSVQQPRHLFAGTMVVSLAAAAFGCTQTMAIVLTHQLTAEQYRQQTLDNYQFAVDLENTAVVLAPLVPWNIAGLVPATVLMVDASFIPYAVYLYLIPLCNLIWQLPLWSVGEPGTAKTFKTPGGIDIVN